MTIDELKPCPFGRGNPKKRKSQYGYYIQIMQPCERYGEEEVYRTPYFHDETELYNFWNTRARKRELVAVDDMDVEIAIAEAIAIMNPRMVYHDKGEPVLAYLKKHGWFVMQDKSNETEGDK